MRPKNHSRYIAFVISVTKFDIMKDENSSDKDEVECDELQDAYNALYEESLKI